MKYSAHFLLILPLALSFPLLLQAQEIHMECGQLEKHQMGEGELKTFTFDGIENEIASIFISALSGHNFTPVGELIDPSGERIPNYSEISGLKHFQFPVSGQYRLLVTDRDLQDNGHVAVQLDHLFQNSNECSTPLECGTLVKSNLSEGEIRYFTFEGEKDDVITLSVVGRFGSGFNPQLDVFLPETNQVDEAGQVPHWKEGIDGLNTYQIPESGTYTVRVKDSNLSDNGGFALQLNWLNPKARSCAKVLVCSKNERQSLDNGEQHLYKFFGNKDDDLKITLSSTFGSDFQATADLYGPSSNVTPVRENIDLNTNSETKLEKPGTYTLLVRDSDHLDNGGYSLTYTWGNRSCCDFSQAQKPGDANKDCLVDISDTIFLLSHMFLGGTQLPCGDGSAKDPANITLLDWNSDQSIDISDAITSISFLFLGGEAHSQGNEPIVIEGCSEE